MHKTLHTTFSAKKFKPHNSPADLKTSKNDDELIGLMQAMKGYLNEAANDLLQPRQEAVTQLLKKLQH